MNIAVYPAPENSWARPFAQDFPTHEWHFADSVAELEAAWESVSRVRPFHRNGEEPTTASGDVVPPVGGEMAPAA